MTRQEPCGGGVGRGAADRVEAAAGRLRGLTAKQQQAVGLILSGVAAEEARLPKLDG